jgi:formate dehydrogenase
VANEARGSNVNLLASSDPDGLEPLAGMAFLNGIPVRVEAVTAGSPAGEQTEAVGATA